MDYTPKYSNNTKFPRKNILDGNEESAEEIEINDSLDENEFFGKFDKQITERSQTTEPAPSSSKGRLHHFNP